MQQAAPLTGNYVLLRADSLRLLLPQEQVGSVQYLDGLLQNTSTVGCFASTQLPDQRIVALDKNGKLLQQPPFSRFMLTTLGASAYMWCWNEVRSINNTQTKYPYSMVRPLPVCMQSANGPIKGYVDLQGELVFVSNAAQLIRYALREQTPEDAAQQV